VKEILVGEGDYVEKDQILLRLDDSAFRANYESVRQQLYSQKIIESRLQAERSGKAKIELSSDIRDMAVTDKELNKQVVLQTTLFDTRKRSIEANRRLINESIRGIKLQIEEIRSIESNRSNNQKILARQLVGVTEMVREGYLAEVQQQDMERNLYDLKSSVSDAVSSQARLLQMLGEANQRLQLTNIEYHKEIDQQLSQLRPEIQALTEKFVAVQNDLDRAEVKSPVQGQVVGLAMQTVGGVIQPGQKIMDVVPEKEELVIEAHIEPYMIDRIKLGSPVNVRFSNFSDSPQLAVEGKLASISSDVTVDQGGNTPPYYLARVNVTHDGMVKLGARKMQAGMQAQVVIKTGQRTLMEYIIGPLIKRVAYSLKEQ
jgi:protease secretion system membrane fusion protein